jgi:hypothetical protein
MPAPFFMDTNIFLELQALNEKIDQWEPVREAFPVLTFLVCVIVGILLHLVFQQIFNPTE